MVGTFECETHYSPKPLIGNHRGMTWIHSGFKLRCVFGCFERCHSVRACVVAIVVCIGCVAHVFVCSCQCCFMFVVEGVGFGVLVVLCCRWSIVCFYLFVCHVRLLPACATCMISTCVFVDLRCFWFRAFWVCDSWVRVCELLPFSLPCCMSFCS